MKRVRVNSEVGNARAWTRVAHSEAVGSLFIVLSGVLIGLLFLVATSLSAKWFFSFLAASLIAGASLLPIDRKVLYLGVLVFLLPIGGYMNLFYQTSTVYHSTNGFRVLLYYLPLGALYLIWMGRSFLIHAPSSISTRGLVPLAGFLAAAVLSILLGGNILFGAYELFAILGNIALFLYASSELRSKTDLRVALVVLFVSVALQAIIAVGQHVTQSSLGLEFFGAPSSEELRYLREQGLSPLTRVGGTLGHPNILARFFVLLLPLGCSLLLCPLRTRAKLSLCGSVSLGTLALTLTLSRAGLLFTGIACFFIILLRLKRRLGLVRASCISMLGLAMLFVILFGLPNPVQTRFVEDDYKTALARVPLMEVALNMIDHRPFLGVGLNNYAEMAPRYDNTPQRITSWWNQPVHNLFLYVAAQTGLIGLSFFLIFLFAVLRAVRPALRSPDPFIAGAAIGVMVGITAFLLHYQVELGTSVRDAPFWFVSGLAVALGRSASGPESRKSE